MRASDSAGVSAFFRPAFAFWRFASSVFSSSALAPSDGAFAASYASLNAVQLVLVYVPSALPAS